MGMFDYIKCDVPLPETPVAPPTDMFQTKDTDDQCMTIHTITHDGHLMWRPYEMQEVPKSERPYPDAADDDWRSLSGCPRRVEQPPERIMFDGDIYFYEGNHPDVGWWEYRATFRNGELKEISLIEFRAPEGRDTNAEIMAARANEVKEKRK